MYLWKCWRTSRSAFYFFLGAFLAVGAVSGFLAWDPLGWHGPAPVSARTLWNASTDAMMRAGVFLLPLAGLQLGTLGVGTEFEKNTADFLLTRPRSRRYFLWTSWWVGAAGLLALAFFTLLRAAEVGDIGDGTVVRGWGILRGTVVLFILSLVVYSLTFLATTLTRSSSKGIRLAVGVLLASGGLSFSLFFWYGIQTPRFWGLLKTAFESSFPTGPALGWLAVSLALVLSAQLYFERAEV